MKLKVGDRAPDFRVQALDGQTLALSDFRGRKVLLSFYRYASCPFCNLRVHELSQRQAAWQAQGLDMIAVFQSPRASILEYVGQQQPPFAILPDPDRALYQAYGVTGSWAGFAKGALNVRDFMSALKQGYAPGKMEGAVNMLPADFVIDEAGQVQLAFYGNDISEHAAVADIEACLR